MPSHELATAILEKARVVATIAPEWEEPVNFDSLPRPTCPVDAFPIYLRQYIGAVAEATQTAPDLTACFVLGSFAGAVARKAELEVREGYREPLNLYLLPIAEPGERKSALCREINLPWDQVEKELVTAAGPDNARLESQRRMLEKERDRAEHDAATDKNLGEQQKARTRAYQLAEELERLEPAIAPALRTEDATPERLKTLLAEQGGRIAILSAEGEIFKIAAGRYSGNGGTSFDCLLKAHAGDMVLVDRQGRPRVVVERPALTIAAAVQPDIVANIFKQPEFRGQGLTARFLYAWPVSPLGSRKTGRPVLPDVRESYCAAVAHVLRWAMPAEPVTLTLSADAALLGIEFEQALEPKLGEFGELRSMTDWAGKLAGAVYRIMGVLHLAEYATTGKPLDGVPPVSRHTAEGAIALGGYFLAHAKVAYGYGGADPVLAGARKILTWVRMQGLQKFVERDCFNRHESQFKTMHELKPCLELLADYRHIAQAPAPAAKPQGGRPPSPVWNVNPTSLTTTRGTV